MKRGESKPPAWFGPALARARWKDALTFQRRYPTPLSMHPDAELSLMTRGNAFGPEPGRMLHLNPGLIT